MLFTDSLETIEVPKTVIDALLNDFESAFFKLNPSAQLVSLELGSNSMYDDSEINFMDSFGYSADFNDDSPRQLINNVVLHLVQSGSHIGDFWSNVSSHIGYVEEDGGSYTYIIDRR